MTDASARSAQLPYSGMRVLDVTRVLASPYATYMLALQGADVIKIEDPVLRGDTLRHRGGGARSYTRRGWAPPTSPKIRTRGRLL